MKENTLSLLIVDDEYLERDLIANCIDWAAIGINIAGKAASAAEALQLIKQEPPEIIFTDINMDDIDGIQFSERVLQEYPNTKIVIITGFDDFEYAQRSIKIGVFDFLLKPIDEDEVLKTVLNLKELIEQERNREMEYSELKKQLADNLPFLRERFLNELISTELDEKTINEKMAFLGMDLKSGSFQVAVIAVDLAQEMEKSEEQRFIFNMHSINLVKSSFKSEFVFFDALNRIVIINDDESIDLYKYCRWLKDKIIEKTGCIVSIGLGNLKRSVSFIRISFREAADALNFRVAVGNNTVIAYNDIHFSPKQHLSTGTELINKLYYYILSGMETIALETIGEIFEDIDLSSDGALKAMRINALNVIGVCLRVMTEPDLDLDLTYKVNLESIAKVYTYDTLPDLLAYLNEIVHLTIESIKRNQVRTINSTTDEIKEYIKSNIMDTELSLSKVAKVFYLNPSYLSRMFKKETSISFIDYVTKVRMENAMELIKEKDMKAWEVAEAVGITSVNYFYICFKKYFGISISNYKSSMNNNP